MESFGEFFARLWLSQLPRQLVHAICVAAVFELLVWLINGRIRVLLRPALLRDRRTDPAARARRMRLLLRPPMLVNRAVMYALALAIILRIFRFPLQAEVLPILAVAFVAGVVGAAPLLQDALRGYVLIHQQLLVEGEEVTVGERLAGALGPAETSQAGLSGGAVRGMVLGVGLLTTRLGLPDGSEVTIANGRIASVVNHSRAAGTSEQTPSAEQAG
jgi:small-conductance mechanosensitive channel